MNTKALTLGAVSLALAAGTFVALNKIAPQRHVEKSQLPSGPSVDEVFGGQLQVAEIEEAAPAPSAAAPAEEAVPATTEMPAAEAAPTEMATVETESSMPAAEAEPATAPGEPTSAPAPAPTAPAAPPPATAAEPTPAPAEAAAEPAPAAAAEPEAAPAPKAVAKPKAKAKAKVAKAAEPVQAWWGAESTSALSVVYAGSAAYRKAIVLMFNGSFSDAAGANASVKVLDASGKKVSGSWELNDKNPRMLVFPVNKAGKYQVVVGNGLKDRNNRSLAQAVQGPVVVR